MHQIICTTWVIIIKIIITAVVSVVAVVLRFITIVVLVVVVVLRFTRTYHVYTNRSLLIP